MRSARLSLCATVVALLLLGCGAAEVPGRMVTITDNALSYTAAPNHYGGTDKFTWNVDTTQAYVRYDGTQLQSGRVQVTFVDAAGAVVLHTTITAGALPASAPTSQGEAGPWTVRLEFNDASGIVAFDAVESH